MKTGKFSTIYVCLFFNCMFMTCCNNKENKNNKETADSTAIKQTNYEKTIRNTDWGNLGRILYQENGKAHYINSVKGHNERDTIIGNFTGKAIDTLYVESVCECKCSKKEREEGYEHLEHEMDDELVKYYMTSTNPALGKVELYGYSTLAPRLVNEGDLDGNGTCEVGYLTVWRLSQWRTYHIFTYKDGEWRHLINPDTELKSSSGGDFLFETGYLLRESGKEVAKPSKRKGWIRVNYQTQGGTVIKDTLVRPDYQKIE